MKFLQICIGIFSLCLFSVAHATQITDIKTFDKIFANGESFNFSYNLADYGFDANSDTLVGQSVLTFEFRDPTYSPDKDVFDRPFISLFIDQGRGYTRVFNEDWVVDNGLAWFNEAGIMTPYLKVDVGDVWLGDVTLRFEFTPGATTEIPEPLPLMLMGIGLLTIVMRRYKSHAELNR